MMRNVTLALGMAVGTLGAAIATAAAADVTVSFRDGAPTDRMTISASAPICGTGPFEMTIDLMGSAAGLIMDVTAAGAGVEVFQPLVLVSGADQVAQISAPQDGDTQLSLTLSALVPAAPVAFTLDLDDTMGGREITVTGAEIVGATVTLISDLTTVTAAFDADGEATLILPGCPS